MDRFLLRSDEKLTGSSSQRADIYDQWLQFITRHLFLYSLAPGSAKSSNFEINARCRSYAGFTVARFTTTGGKCRLHRATADIASDPQDRYVVYLPLHGDLEFSQLGREQISKPVSFTLLSSSEPITHSKLGDNDTLVLLMPREFVDQRIVTEQKICTHSVAAKNGVGLLAYQSLLALQQEASSMGDPHFQSAAALVGDLVLLALSGGADLSSGQRSVRAANTARVKRYIQMNLSDCELTLDDIAQGCGLSLNYIHKLFRDEGYTLSEYLKSQRLERARQMLESPMGSGTTVTEISLACGFSNMSHFSTAFRRTFSISPSDVLHARRVQ